MRDSRDQLRGHFECGVSWRSHRSRPIEVYPTADGESPWRERARLSRSSLWLGSGGAWSTSTAIGRARLLLTEQPGSFVRDALTKRPRSSSAPQSIRADRHTVAADLPVLRSTVTWPVVYPTCMRTINASEFRARCLTLLDEAPHRWPITILKGGYPVAQLTPVLPKTLRRRVQELQDIERCCRRLRSGTRRRKECEDGDSRADDRLAGSCL